MTLLNLQESICYGPVSSRRLGCSLGVNILPFNYKLCSLNCVYCQYGWTEECRLRAGRRTRGLPSPEEVSQSLRKCLATLKERGVTPPYITFSGNGEPTLHPQFERIVRAVREIRDELAPDALVAVLSNSTTVTSEGVRRALELCDVRIMKVDCGDAETFGSYNRPCRGVTLKDILEGLKKLSRFTVQTLFTDRNSSDDLVEEWVKVIGELRPSDVQIYSLDRASPCPELEAMSKDRLRQIALRLEEASGIRAAVY
ncbi:MAG: radical SAM protein [Candidatus Eiseniibacteriota bacterium]|nr:MAG: radical SAM protein [Candidatus Eisenbacteria bacterium]